MLRIMKQTVWLIAATIMLGGLSFAQRRDDGDDHRSRDHWRDRRDRDDHDRNDHDRDAHRWSDRDRNHRYRDDRRYESWEYRNRGWRDDEIRDRYYRRDPGTYGYGGGSYVIGGYERGNRGFSFGYQDGTLVAREDMWRGKPYHPDPRGKYEDADHGYDRYYGSKGQYRAEYAEGYRRGYIAAFRGRY
jgi:hypothetical protein